MGSERRRGDGAPSGPGRPRRLGSRPGSSGPTSGSPSSWVEAERADTPAGGSAVGLPALSEVPPPPMGRMSLPPDERGAGEPMPEDAAPPRARRVPTLTGRIRAVQPPDVARQALREQELLASELLALPEALERGYMARAAQHEYLEAARDELDLARMAWEAVAEERLEQRGAEPAYRQRAVAVARRLTHLQQRAEAGARDPAASSRRPLLWRRRTALASEGLRLWQENLPLPADPLRMGEGLFLLRGYLGLAGAGGVELMTLRALVGAGLVFTPALGVGLLLLFASALTGGASTHATTYGAAALLAALAWILTLLLTTLGRARLGLLLGASSFSRARAAGNGRRGSAFVAGALRAWWLLVGMAGVVALVAALAVRVAAQVNAGAPATPTTVAEGLKLGGDIIVRLATLPTLASLAALALLALPAQLVALVRFAAELGGRSSWVPAARRYLLGPALTALLFISGALFAGAWLGATALDLEGTRLPTLRLGTFVIIPTLRTLALFLAAALPYLLAIELPYRIGIRRWRRRWQRELSTRRADLESHVRRLSAADPRSGAQDTTDENLRAMQYDLVLLEFYRAKEAEARGVSAAPLRPAGALLPLMLALAAALLADGVGGGLVGLLALLR